MKPDLVHSEEVTLALLRERFGSDKKVFDYLIHEVTRHSLDDKYILQLAKIYAELREKSLPETDTFEQEIQRAFSRSETVFLINVIIMVVLSGILQRLIEKQYLEIDLPEALDFFVNNTGNLAFSMMPMTLGFLPELVLQATKKRKLSPQERTELYDSLRSLLETLLYIFPFLMAISLIIYNFDVETTQSLPYIPSLGPWQTNQPGTADLKDIPAGIYGILSSLYILRNRRRSKALDILKLHSQIR